MKKLAIISIAVGAIGIFAYFVYSTFSHQISPNTIEENRVAKSGSVENMNKPSEWNGTTSTNLQNENQSSKKDENLPSSPAEEIISAPIENSINKNNSSKINIRANITHQHCEDDCKAFAIDLSLFAYCEEACGISPIKSVSNCDGKKDLEKDYCQKDLAITKGDASLCDGIKDDNIRKTCQNRITEDAVEKMQSGTQE